MKNVRSAHVFDLKSLKEFYLVFRIYYKNSFYSGNIIKTIILLGAQLLCINTNKMTSSPEIRK